MGVGLSHVLGGLAVYFCRSNSDPVSEPRVGTRSRMCNGRELELRQSSGRN